MAHLNHPLLIAACAVLIGACASSRTPTPERTDFAVIAYVYPRADADLGWIDAAHLTHVNYAFANVDSTGAVVLEREGDAALLAQLTALRAKNPDLKILLSVGGWGWSDHFSDAALTEASRATFAETAAALVRAHGLDGLDIDWEYPGQPGDGNTFRPEDRDNFTLLLRDIRAMLDALETTEDRQMLLTIAGGANQHYLDLTNLAEAQQYLDFVNVMTYDYFGSYTGTTGHHTNLAPPDAPNDSNACAISAIAAYIAAGVPAEKIVVGAAFYGKGWAGVRAIDYGRYQPYERYAGSYSYARLAADFIDKNGYERHWDQAARAPYLWQSDSSVFISYDDPESVRLKAEYVRARGLGGMMWWEHTQDPDQTLLRAIAEVLRPE